MADSGCWKRVLRDISDWMILSKWERFQAPVRKSVATAF